MRTRCLWTTVLALPLAGCCPCPYEPRDAPKEAKTEAKETTAVRSTRGDYYGPPAPIVLDPPPVPPEIVGPTPLDRLPKE